MSANYFPHCGFQFLPFCLLLIISHRWMWIILSILRSLEMFRWSDEDHYVEKNTPQCECCLEIQFHFLFFIYFRTKHESLFWFQLTWNGCFSFSEFQLCVKCRFPVFTVPVDYIYWGCNLNIWSKNSTGNGLHQRVKSYTLQIKIIVIKSRKWCFFCSFSPVLFCPKPRHFKHFEQKRTPYPCKHKTICTRIILNKYIINVLHFIWTVYWVGKKNQYCTSLLLCNHLLSKFIVLLHW